MSCSRFNLQRALVPAVVAFGLLVAAAVPAQQSAKVGEPRKETLTWRYEKPASVELESLYTTLSDSRLLETWTAYVNRLLPPLPRGIETAFAECGEIKSWYDAEQSRITLCYEEADRIFGTLHAIGYESETQLLTAWIGSMLLQLYHELGHALVQMLALPVIGRMEDGADQFAVIALLGHPAGSDLVLGAADYLQQLARVEARTGPDYAQRHPHFSQRYYNMLCLTYGSDPGKHNSLVTEGRLPAARAETCRAEFAQAAYGWGTLLDHDMK